MPFVPSECISACHRNPGSGRCRADDEIEWVGLRPHAHRAAPHHDRRAASPARPAASGSRREQRAADVVEAAGSVVCLHATDPATVFLSARARVDGMAVANLERALYVNESLIKHLAMRRTLFVFPRPRLADAVAAASARVAGPGAAPAGAVRRNQQACSRTASVGCRRPLGRRRCWPPSPAAASAPTPSCARRNPAPRWINRLRRRQDVGRHHGCRAARADRAVGGGGNRPRHQRRPLDDVAATLMPTMAAWLGAPLEPRSEADATASHRWQRGCAPWAWPRGRKSISSGGSARR